MLVMLHYAAQDCARNQGNIETAGPGHGASAEQEKAQGRTWIGQ